MYWNVRLVMVRGIVVFTLLSPPGVALSGLPSASWPLTRVLSFVAQFDDSVPLDVGSLRSIVFLGVASLSPANQSAVEEPTRSMSVLDALRNERSSPVLPSAPV